MADAKPDDPGGGHQNSQREASYADRLKTNIRFDQRLKRNILEITLEKTMKDAELILDQQCVARVLRSIGLDVENQVEGYQVLYNSGRHIISVWVLKDLNLDRFCREENINVAKGIVTGNIRPAGRRDVTVTVSGLDFNTPDTLVCEYIRKFGGIILNTSIIYCKFTEGPFKGKFNGERKYQVDFTNSSKAMGTYHFLDGARVRIFYRGNIKTCGRCHKTARNCSGGGIARDCEDQGGVRIHLSDHMKQLWAEIRFTPTSFELPESDDGEGDKPIADSSNFQRLAKVNKTSQEDKERYCGLRINNLPLAMTEENIMKFLTDHVASDISKDKVNIIRYKKTTSALVLAGLSSEVVSEALSNIDFTTTRKMLVDVEVPLYCRPLRDITPEKQSAPTTPRKDTGTRPRTPIAKIPGLPPHAQAKAIDRQKKRESEKKKDKKARKIDSEAHDKATEPNSTTDAFEILMRRENRSLLARSSSSSSPTNLDSSPDLKGKRTAASLDSPNSPTENISKKNKVVATPNSQ